MHSRVPEFDLLSAFSRVYLFMAVMRQNFQLFAY